MKILVTSGTSAGSWKIRGQQLGFALDADVINNVALEHQKEYDIIIVVKKPPKQWKPSGIVVWDMVDFWPQPDGNAFTREQLISLAQDRKGHIGAHYCVAATQQMQIDTKAEVCIYHHARDGQLINPIREKVEVIGYEGDERYLGEYREVVEQWCRANGASLSINPDSLASCDIVLALRAGRYRGYATDFWKSNVKLANAQWTGTPIICLPEAGYTETACGTEVFVDGEKALIQALYMLSPVGVRKGIHHRMLHCSSAVGIHQIARGYKEWLSSLS